MPKNGTPSPAHTKTGNAAAMTPLSPQEQELVDRMDEGGIIEATYLHHARLREKDHLTEEETQWLAEHEALEARIESDPQQVLREARAYLDKGVSALIKLIRSRRLYRCHKFEDGTVFTEWDEALDLLLSRYDSLSRDVIHLAERGLPNTEMHLFYGAKNLTEAFIRQAQLRPAAFVDMARRTATMPSLRSRHSGYTADAAVIAKAIQLGEDHPAPDLQDNRSRAGAHSHYLVAKILETIQSNRDDFRRDREQLERFQAFEETADKYRGVTLEEYLREHYHPSRYGPLMACAALGELRDDAENWWVTRVLPMVKEAFEALAKRPQSNPALWQELGRGGEAQKDSLSDRRRYLEKLCKNKFDQIARTARRKPAHGQAS